MPVPSPDSELADRARAWRHDAQDEICEIVEPWEYGTVVRAPDLPDYWQYNLVRVERRPDLTPEELIAFGEEALSGLRHVRFDLDDMGVAPELRRRFDELGWLTVELVWMRHEAAPPPAGPEIEVTPAAYEEVHDLRVAWHREDFGDAEEGGYYEAAEFVARRRNASVIASRDGDGRAISFAQTEWAGGDAEIAQVYVHPDFRGGGRGTAMTRAATEAALARDPANLWICADADDRPQHLYARLGFRTVARSWELTRLPE